MRHPTQILPVITNEEPNKASFYQWGLVPPWAKNETIGQKLINARGETLKDKPSFRHALKQRRCLVISDGFYEWKRTGSMKQPYRITMKDNSLFAFAGLWESWKSTDEIDLRTFTIITVEPNNLIRKIHNRMPAILDPKDEKRWIANERKEGVLHLLKPYNENEMTAYPVSDRVNSPLNNDSDLLKNHSGSLFDDLK